MKDTYLYAIGENLYVNLTNRCTNACTFCVRNGKEEYEGHFLWLQKEPEAEDILSNLSIEGFKEIVFCGFGEPTERLDVMLSVAEWVKKKGGTTRLNTNGHGNAIAKRNIAPLLKGKIDSINISLNAPTKEEYDLLCRPNIPNAFEETLSFARACKREGIPSWFSVVDVIGKEAVEKCGKIAESVGIPLRVREMIE